MTASLDGTIAVCGGAAKGSGRGDGVLQRLQVRFAEIVRQISPAGGAARVEGNQRVIRCASFKEAFT